MSFPNANQFKETYVFRDAKGNTARMSFIATTNGGASSAADTDALFTGIATALVNMSNAALQSALGPYCAIGVRQYGTHATNGAYETVEEKAVIVYQDGLGGIHRINVPAPHISVFMNDKQTVSPTNSLVTALNTAVLSVVGASAAQITSLSGVTWTNFMGGYFRATKLRKRVNLFVLDANLDPSEPAE